MINSYRKIIAWKLLTIFTFSNIIPLNMFAVSSGPSQPEVETFQPIGASGLVNKYSGDFSYNLPIMSVPGPNGSYPINLIYSAGPSMYQEASWVGLGWNLNPGAIKRHLNGVPDEFNGDLVTHFNYEKKHSRRTETLGAEANGSVGIKKGKAGVSGSAGASYSWIDDSYRGDGFSFGYSLEASAYAKLGKVKPSLGLNNSVSLSSFDGITSSFGISYGIAVSTGKFSGASLSSGINWTYNSKSGYRGTSYSSSVTRDYAHTNKVGRAAKKRIRKYVKDNKEKAPWMINVATKPDVIIASMNTSTRSVSLGSSFTNNDNVTSSISTSGMARTGESTTWGLELGVDFDISSIVNLGGNVSYTNTLSESWPVSEELSLNSYGFLNLGNYGMNGAMDYATHNQAPLSLTTPSISYPKYAQDGFVVNGQGLSGFFQAKRHDIGLLHQNESDGYIDHSSDEATATFGFGMKAGEGSSSTPGSGLVVSYNTYANSFTRSTISKWDDDLLTNFESEFKQTLSDDDYYEAYSFLSTGELTFRDEFDETNVFLNDEVIVYDLKEQHLEGSYRNKNLFGLTNTAPLLEIKKERTQRHQYFNPITFKEYKDIRTAYSGTKVGYLYNKNQHPDELPVVYENVNDYVANAYNYYPHHFKEIQVYNVGGELYEYGIPAYNNESREITFSSNHMTEGTKVRSNITIEEVEGHQKSYKGPKMTDYAHSYLLSAIYSPDYVDITNNGPTEDDFGFWVKFNYTKVHNNFEWGTPALGMANYKPGNASNKKDQYGSFQSGSKKLYYLNSVETKTHIAKFKISNRADSKSGSLSLQKLDRVELYNKEDDKVLKTVHLNYDYSLCPGGGDPGSGSSLGKLTLKKIYTTYRDNLKGRLAPYTFDYNHNPSFKFGNFDAWGIYKEEDVAGPYIDQVPFTKQMDNEITKSERDLNASSWSLSTITLPSKGTIEVEYEMDDYLWVQGQKSMQMHEIVGMATTSQLNETDVENTGDVSDKYRVFFNLHLDDFTNVNLDEYVEALVEDIDMLYFRTWMHYKRGKYDYAKGYAPVATNFGHIDYQGTKVGYIDIKPTRVYSSKMKGRKTSHGNAIKVHPFQAEVIKQIQHYRPDLEFIEPESIKMQQLWVELRKGFETMAIDKKFGEEYDVSNNFYPSFIRLNTANKAKYGGGHRVKSVRITDHADDLGLEVASYGKMYHYLDKDGNSSGVTGSEPFASKEESPYKFPKFYSSVFDYERQSFNDRELYTDYCLADPFFQSASIGYSRVLEESTAYDVNGDLIQLDPRVADGIIEDQYYTPKDYPVIFRSKLNEPKTSFDRPGWAPPLASYYKKHDSYGFSQGLTVEVNDMSGKLKSVAKYPYYSDVTSPSFNGITSVYKEIHKYKGTYGKLKSIVNLSNGGESDLGLDIQTAIAVEQNRTYSEIQDVKAAFKFYGIIPIPQSVQYTNTQELNNAQTISTTKLISRNGILESNEVYVEGHHIKKTNNLYNPITANVSEVSYVDEFNVENVITSKSAAAFEEYAQTRGKYLYDNLHFPPGIITSGSGNSDKIHITLHGRPNTYLKEGDKLLITSGNNKYIAYISQVINQATTSNSWEGDIEFMEYTGLNLHSIIGSYSDIQVIDPANTNQLTLNAYSKTTRDGGVLSAHATTYKDTWLDNGFEKAEIENYTLSSFSDFKYTNGQKGILRPDNVYSFNGERAYGNNTNKGVFVSFVDFDYDPTAQNDDWISPVKSAKYSPYGYGIESEDLREVKSSAFYDYNKSLVTISAQNAAYKEIAFDAFEDYNSGEREINHGHLKWTLVDDPDPVPPIYKHLNVSISDESRHTGSQSLKFVLENLLDDASFEFNAKRINQPVRSGYWEFENNKKYIIQYWEKPMGEITGLPFFVEGGTHTLTLESSIQVGDWIRKEYVLLTDNSSIDLNMQFYKPIDLEGVVYIDDFRITPFNSVSKAFVYDNNTFDTKAILDNNNFASIYHYDEQGNLVITKQETVEGIKSISSNRSNIQQ